VYQKKITIFVIKLRPHDKHIIKNPYIGTPLGRGYLCRDFLFYTNLMTELTRCLKMLDEGFSLLTVGKNKQPNFAWKSQQSKQLTKTDFTNRYEYTGGTLKKNGDEIDPTNGVGYCTGFNDIEVIDIDLKVLPTLAKQTEWWDEYLSFLKDNIADFDDKFVIYKTVNNGYHIIYKCKTIGGNVKIASLKGHKQAIIETRGKGGYCFIYDRQISKLDYYNIQEISEKDREVLMQCSAFYDYKVEVVKHEPTKVEQKEYPDVEITPWNDFNDKTSMTDLISDEFTIVRSMRDKYIIKRHGADSPHSGYIYKDSNCMYLFTTGTRYDNEVLLSPYAVYTIKYHSGNFSASAKELYSKGYGSRIIKKVDIKPVESIKIDESNFDFPIEIIPENLRHYVLECNRTLDSSVDYMGCALIWLYSTMIGNSIKVEVKKGWIETATVWISVVGKAGLGKTPSLDNIIRPLMKANNREVRKYIKQMAKFQEYERLSKEDKKHSEEIKLPRKSQFIANDITLEALVELHEENNNSVGVFKDELAGWLKDMNKYRAGSDLEFWLSTWSGKSVSMNRKTAKSSFVSQPFIPVLGGIQPSILSTFYTDENKDNGFIDRMLLSFPELEVDKYNDSNIEKELIQWYDDSTIHFYNFIKNELIRYDNDGDIEPNIATFSEDAKAEWIRIFNDITKVQNDDNENEYMKSMLPKQKSYIPRFALILNTINGYENETDLHIISKESMLQAEKLSKYFISMAKKIKVSSSEVNKIKKVLRKNEDLSVKEQFEILYKSNPDLNKKETSELLNVSRTQIYKFIKEIDNA